MPEAPVRSQVHQTLDVLLHLAPQITLHLVASLDGVADGLDVRFAELVDLAFLRNAGLLANLAGRRASDSVDVGQRVSDRFTARQIDSSNPCHLLALLSPAAACGEGSRR